MGALQNPYFETRVKVIDGPYSKCHQRLNEIFIFLTAPYLGNRQSCLQENSVIQYFHKTWRTPVRSACAFYNCMGQFHTAYTWRVFLWKTYFPDVRVKSRFSSSRWWCLELATSAIAGKIKQSLKQQCNFCLVFCFYFSLVRWVL